MREEDEKTAPGEIPYDEDIKQDDSGEEDAQDEETKSTLQDPLELQGLAHYERVSRRREGKIFPHPFRLANPAVAKDPSLWPLLWDKLHLQR
jgi:hypothetical protein